MSKTKNKEPLTRVLHVYDESDGPIEDSKFRLLDSEDNEVTLSYFAQQWDDWFEAKVLVERESQPEAVLELKLRIRESDPLPRHILKRHVIPWLMQKLRFTRTRRRKEQHDSKAQ